MATTIKLKRSRSIPEDVKDTVLNFGEPAYVNNTYLYIGKGTDDEGTAIDESTINDQKKVFKALPIGVVDKQLFYHDVEQVADAKYVWLNDEKGNWLVPETTADQVFISPTNDETIRHYIDNKNFAGSSSPGGAADSALTALTAQTLNLNSAVGSDSTPIYFNSSGSPAVCAGPLDIAISGNADSATNAGNIAVGQKTETKLYLTGTTAAPDPGFARYMPLYNNNAIYISENNVLIGAAWNDFAELRQCTAEPGTCVAETGTGPLIRSTERLQPGCSIVSDTYGMLIGPQEPNYKAIAVAGRVLATPFEDRELFTAGAAVCSAPDGKISIMTREEIKEFPDRIVGYVSEIPNYDVWTNGVKVNNRIWIKVK